MQPFYQDPNKDTTIYLGDCIVGMNELPEGLYDIICTSPPYAIGKDYEKEQSFGEYLRLLSDFYECGYRIIKKGGYAVVVFADYYMFAGSKTRIQPMTYLHHIIAERHGWVHQTTRIWLKNFASLIDPYTITSTLPKLEHEWVASFRKPGGGKEKIREQDIHSRSVWSTVGKSQSVSTLKNHPAAFPEHLVVMILNVYSGEGDTVIDPFGGSGTVPFVAKKMGRKAIMFETNPGYCEASRVRLCQQIMDMANIVKPAQTNFMEVLGNGKDAGVHEPVVKKEGNA